MEKPNLNYINSLAREDDSIKKILIDVIKTEFPEEKQDYYESFCKNDFKKIKDNVHRLKHKISILGLENGYKNANAYEHNLRVNSKDKSEIFDKTLVIISEYLKII
jgi:hypothetical protein